MKRIILLLLIFFIVNKATYATEIEKIYGATFPSTYFLYIFSPDLLLGWNAPLRDYEKIYIPAKYQNLPILGGYYGEGFIPDKEMLMKSGVKKAFILTGEMKSTQKMIKTLQQINIKVITVRAVRLEDYITAFKELGRLINMPERGIELSNYAQFALDRVNKMTLGLKASDRPTVYFAQGHDGLSTSCSGSSRSEAIEIAGGQNVHKCDKAVRDNIMRLSFEQILLYDPDVILIQSHVFMKKFKDDKKWQQLRAVKNGRIYLTPYEPFSWLDRPASYMRFIGILWLVCKLHTDRCSIDIDKETTEFIKLFFHTDLTAGDLKRVLLK